MLRKGWAICLMSLMIKSVMAGAMTVVPTSFEQFTTNFVAAADRQDFSEFFNQSMEKIKGYRSLEKRQKALQALKDTAHSSLSIRRPMLAQSLAPYVAIQKSKATAQAVTANNFLLYYGVHESFLYEKITARASMWAKVRTSFDSVKSRVTSWVSSFKKEEAA